MIFKFNKNFVYDIKDEISGNKKYLSEHKGIYKFYIKEDLLKLLIEKLGLDKFSDLQKNNLLETITLKNNYNVETYYCAYVGQAGKRASNFFKRIVERHINNSSSLCVSFIKILNFDKDRKKKTFNEECIFILQQSFSINNKNINLDEKELKEINNGYVHILNLDKNGFYLKDSKHIDILLEIQKLRNNFKKVKSSTKTSKNTVKSPKNSTNSKSSTSSKTTNP